MSRNYKVSVVIATYNRSVSVERVLNALSDQTFPTEDYEVVVSIDGSRDGTREMVDKYESDYDAAHQRSTRLGVIGAVPIIVDLVSSPVVRYVGEKFNSHPGFCRLSLKIRTISCFKFRYAYAET